MAQATLPQIAQPLRYIPKSSASVDTALAKRLRQTIKGDVLFDEASRGRYSTDASIYQIQPIGVVVPRDQTDLRSILDLARTERVAILARGAGTSQCGQTVGNALIIDNSKWLNQIIDFDAEAKTVTVEPGVVLDHLNAWLKPHGLWFPVDVSTAAQCTIGGMTGNNSCGSRSIEYGNMVHNVLGIDAILADGSEAYLGSLRDQPQTARLKTILAGVQQIAAREANEIRERIPKVLRRVAGYNLDIFDCQNPRAYTDDGHANLAHLLVGSEGTLAYSRQVTLKLAPLPKHKTLGVVNFPSFYQSMAMTQHIVKLMPSAVELVDRTMIDLARSNPAFRPVIDKALIGEPAAILLVEFAGEDQPKQFNALKQLVELMAELGLPDSVISMPEAAAQKALWDVRKAGLNIMMSMKGDGKPVSFIEDCAVPLEHLADYTSRLTEVFHRYGTEGTWYAHASVGTLHVRPILDMRRDGAHKMRAIAEEAAAMVREYKGAYSGEHGDGLCRGEWVSWQYGPNINQAFSEIKDLFDPENLMNPDKMVRPPKMDDTRNFRFPPGYQELPIKPSLDWSAWNVSRDALTGLETAPGSGNDLSAGLAKAVEMCNNNGHCRKFDAGTMCPSYRVTRDEQHVTRGRANTLRLALSGQLGSDGLASSAVKDTLDLCVSCKGCKRDCPTGVDMAKMKIEARAAWGTKHGLSLRDKAVAYLPHYAGLASRLSGLLTIAQKIPFITPTIKKSLGLASERSLPIFKPSFLSQQEKLKSSGASVQAEQREVVLFVDTFNNHLEPDNARAALKVLRAAGYHVHLPKPMNSKPVCCGRTFLAAGLIEQAKQEARHLLDTFKPFIDKGISIVGLEPSCLLSLRDEFLQFGFGAEAQKLSEHAFLFEEFLLQEQQAGFMKIPLKALHITTAMLHGHCHQKAFDALTPVQTVLGWIPKLKVSTIESSCCGMAGSFGYEAEHYEASMAMAELSLLPAVRGRSEQCLVVADGTSCRHQIQDGAATEALHVARVLEMALDI
jgi:FAD/FMN-containing dehydrogenase/Fe-S oxidoreductase